MTTDVIVPDTTVTTITPGSLRMFIGGVVRIKTGHLHHQAGTKAIVCATRESGRFQLELVVPGFPIKFWVTLDDIEILEAPQQDWWKLLESPE